MGPRGSKVSDPLFPYTPLFRSLASGAVGAVAGDADAVHHPGLGVVVAAGVVLGGPVVPERHRAGCPREAALVLRAVHLLVEAEQERVALRLVEADDVLEIGRAAGRERGWQ